MCCHSVVSRARELSQITYNLHVGVAIWCHRMIFSMGSCLYAVVVKGLGFG